MADNQINMINLNEIFQDVKTDQIRQLLNETKDSKTCMWYRMCALDGMNDNELLQLAGYTIPQIMQLIKNAKILEDSHLVTRDVLIDGKKIVKVSES